MPLYRFVCDKCKEQREIKLTFAEHTEKKDNMFCECGEKLVQRVESSKFVLKGSGWYASGYSGGYDTQKELDDELRIYDGFRNNNENNKFEREADDVSNA